MRPGLFDLDGKVAWSPAPTPASGQAHRRRPGRRPAPTSSPSGRSAPGRDGRRWSTRPGRKLHAVSADLGTTEPIARVVAEAERLRAASTSWSTTPASSAAPTALDFTEADWDAVMDINLKTAFFLTQAVARRWLADGPRRQDHQHRLDAVVPGRRPRAVLHRAQERPRGPDQGAGQRVGGARGSTSTPSRPATSPPTTPTALRADETRSRQILERIPAGRWGEPDDLAGAAVFLASARLRLHARRDRAGGRRLAGALASRQRGRRPCETMLIGVHRER